MATTTTNLLSWEAFEQLPDDGMHHEVIEGELITLPPAQLPHTWIAKRLYKALLELEKQGAGVAFHETGYKLSNNPPTWLQPDVSFLRPGRAAMAQKYFTGAPDLAVEVVSPSDSPADLDRKVEILLAAGSTAVWVVFPETRRVRIFHRDGTSASRGINDKLSLPELLPDWELPVAKLFED